MTEQLRLELQAQLDAQKTQAERNRLGQFATPTALAVALLAEAVALLGEKSKVRFLDPAIGTGAFYSALRSIIPLDKIECARGFEIDPHYGLPASKLWIETPLEYIHADFTRQDTPENDSEKFNLIICNPPYVRHHHLRGDEKSRLRSASNSASGVQLSGLAGLYCHFLCLSHPWLTKGGVAAWLIPSEFMDVNYGAAIKDYLINRVTLLRIHRFDPNDVQFGDALVSSAVVFFKNTPPPQSHSVEFSFGGTLSLPELSKHVPSSVLARETKWSRYPRQDTRRDRNSLTIGDIFKIRRGIATGDNKFFILPDDQIEAHRLPREFFRPILPSPRYLKNDVIDSDALGYPANEIRLSLLDCRLSPSEIEKTHPSLWYYLKSGEAAGTSGKYLCCHRTPWYAQEKVSPARILCTYLARSDSKRENPFRFILNNSQAVTTNVYLSLNPKPALENAIEKNPELATKIWQALNSITPEVLMGEGRVYGGGLHKLEPKELANVPIPDIEKLLKKHLVPTEFAPLHSGDAILG